jgi:hypothetical protein
MLEYVPVSVCIVWPSSIVKCCLDQILELWIANNLLEVDNLALLDLRICAFLLLCWNGLTHLSVTLDLAWRLLYLSCWGSSKDWWALDLGRCCAAKQAWDSLLRRSLRYLKSDCLAIFNSDSLWRWWHSPLLLIYCILHLVIIFRYQSFPLCLTWISHSSLP